MSRRKLTPSQRKAISVRMKAMWAERRNEKNDTEIVKTGVVVKSYGDRGRIETRFANKEDAVPAVIELMLKGNVKELRIEQE